VTAVAAVIPVPLNGLIVSPVAHKTSLAKMGFTPGAKVNPEHSHPFDVKAMVLKGALTLHRDGQSQTYKSGETFAMPRGCLHHESYGDEGAVVLFGRKF